MPSTGLEEVFGVDQDMHLDSPICEEHFHIIEAYLDVSCAKYVIEVIGIKIRRCWENETSSVTSFYSV